MNVLERREVWASVLPVPPNPVWQEDARRILVEAESRRWLCDYNTGSIAEFEAYLLRSLAEFLQARVVIDVGTFIGTSACALASASTVQALYTCDSSNDCLRPNSVITTFPKTSSTTMLANLAKRGVRSGLCFFDGVLQLEDIGLLAQVTTPQVVFAVHDYNYGPKMQKHGGLKTVPRKGIGNIRALKQQWPSHVVVEPLPESLVALLVPESLL